MMVLRSRFGPILIAVLTLLPVVCAAAHNNRDETYDYIVVGSGPGGGVTASNLALAGYSVLLLEAGSDDSDEQSTEIAALSYPGISSLQWSFFVKHHSDAEQELRNNHLTWQFPNGTYWVGSGAKAPGGARLLGVYYPRGVTLGGSAIVNAMAVVLPRDNDWDYIANLTGDLSWRHDKMREVFEKIEKNHYLPDRTPGHGFKGFMDTMLGSPSYYNRSPGRISFMKTQAQYFGLDPEKWFSYLGRDVNFLAPDGERDHTDGIFGISTHTNAIRRRWSPRDQILSTANAVNDDGSRKYRLKVQVDSLATRVLFTDPTSAAGKYRASGVEFLEGSGVYKATWLYDSKTANKGTLKRAFAKREVIISGGTFNSPQLLQLSGIGDRNHLATLGIKAIVDLPGVGRNLQDNQELPVVGHGVGDFTVAPDPEAANCTFGAPGDPCVALWKQGLGPYTGPPGNSECGFLTTKHSPDGTRDVLFFAPPGVLRGFYPPTKQTDPGVFTDPLNTASVNMVRMGSQNNAGFVRIASRDPTDVPEINFQHFVNGADLDIGAMKDTIAWTRRAFADVPAPYGPIKSVEPPCPAGLDADGYCLDPLQDEQWIREQTFGHHPTGTCRIGNIEDPMAVLDSRFRVRGVEGLRVVDASVFPRIPGAFPVVATTMVGQKASQVIMEDTINLKYL